MDHSFNVEIAVKYGIEKAIIIQNLAFWIKKNAANKTHFIDGKHWTYNSSVAFSKLFPYWSPQKISRKLRELEDEGIIITANYNEKSFDKTKWYSIIEQSIVQIYNIDCSELNNGVFRNEQPIPDSKPDSKPDIIDYSLLINAFNSITGKKSRIVPDKAKRQLKARLKEGYTKKEILQALKNCCKDEYHKDTNLKYVTLEFITRSDKLDKYLHATPFKQTYDPNDL